MRYCLAILFIIITTSPSYSGTINYYNPEKPDMVAAEPNIDKKSGTKTLSITPIKSCYSNLDEKEVANIKRHYIKPYKECLRRVAKKEREKKTLKMEKKPQPGKDVKKQEDTSPKIEAPIFNQ